MSIGRLVQFFHCCAQRGVSRGLRRKIDQPALEFQQSADTLGDAMRQLKEKELNDLQTRYQEFQQMASSDMQKKQMELLQPIQQKCVDAIKEVAQAGGYIVVFDMATGSLAYIDEAATTDISAEVKAKLGIQ